MKYYSLTNSPVLNSLNVQFVLWGPRDSSFSACFVGPLMLSKATLLIRLMQTEMDST